MSIEYGGYGNLFATSVANDISAEYLSIITESRASTGVNGCLTKPPTVEQAAAFDALNQAVLARTIRAVYRDGPPQPPQDLSDHEFAELLGAAEGMKGQEVARQAGYSRHAGNQARRDLYALFDATNRPGVVFRAIVQGALSVRTRTVEPKPDLAPRHIEALGLAARGLNRSAMSRLFNVTESALNTHCRALIRQLDAITIGQAVYRAFELGVWRLPVEIPPSST